MSAQIRTKSIKIRVTDSEHKQLKEKADSQQLAVFMRDYCLNKETVISKRKQYPTIDPDFIKIFAGVANNINQLTRYAHTQKKGDALQVAELAYQLMLINAQLSELKEIAKKGIEKCS